MRRIGLFAIVLTALATGCAQEDSLEEAHQAFTGIEEALREAGSATVDFEVRLRSHSSLGEAVTWQGTTRTRYGDPTVSETDFDAFTVRVPTGFEPTTERIDLVEVKVGDSRYHRSETLDLPTERPWLRLEPGTYQQYGSGIANPDLGVVDLAFYTGLLASVDDTTAYAGLTDHEQEIDGVRTRMYRLYCSPGTGSSTRCSYPDIGAPLQRIFSGEESTISIDFWLDDEGRPRQLDVEGDLDTGHQASETGDATIYYQLTATLTVGGFGEPVEVSEPPADLVTTDWPA